MERRKQYNGLDVAKVVMAVLVAARHVIQIYYPVESKWQLLIGRWLSNLAVPLFFTIAGFFLFRKVEDRQSGRTVVLTYCGRILKLYLLWSVLYWPVDYFNWRGSGETLGEYLVSYLHCFLFSSTIVQLWYLPALLVACLLVWFAYSRGMKLWQMLLVGACLLFFCWIGDNWYFNDRFPPVPRQWLMTYVKIFLSVRNGLFYGTFYVCLGLWFSRTEKRPPFWVSVLGAGFFTLLMGYEVYRCSITNVAINAAPATFFLFSAASSVKWKNRKLYPRLRAMSEWIYLSHVYFIYLYTWTIRWNPLPHTKKGITISIFVPLLLFSWGMAVLAEKERFRWVKKLI